jgi:hypothetical protein
MTVADQEIEAQPLPQEPPTLGRDGEPCAQCGSPLAADQRYCLECGCRRGGPRVDYRQRMLAAATGVERQASGPAQPEPADTAGPAEPARAERDFAPLAAVGGIAVLGLMLLVGVLIGRGNGDSAPAPAPVVLPAGSGAATAGTEGGGGAADGNDLGLGGDSKGAAKKKNAKGGGGETAAEAGAVTASKDQLEELQDESGEEAAKNALKLPDKIATPGKPPPIDKSKPPGGGEGGAVTIE